MRLAIVVGLSVAALAAGGCGQKKLTECNALVKVIDDGVMGIEKAPKNEADTSGVSDLRTMADSMDKIAADAAAVELTLPDLKKMRDDYQKMAKEIARAERELADAAQDHDPDLAHRAKRRAAAEAALDAAVKPEDPLVDQINKYCHAP